MNFEFDDLPLWDHLRMHLLEGKQNAVKQANLARECGVPRRAIQEAIEGAKRAGMPVVTGGRGVWLTSDWRELLDAYRRDRNRANRQHLNNRGRLPTIQKMQAAELHLEQQTLFGDNPIDGSGKIAA